MSVYDEVRKQAASYLSSFSLRPRERLLVHLRMEGEEIAKYSLDSFFLRCQHEGTLSEEDRVFYAYECAVKNHVHRSGEPRANAQERTYRLLGRLLDISLDEAEQRSRRITRELSQYGFLSD